ncbi:MAG: hypothetical protein H7Y04_00590 [Verrucomicrobia bacterium]|nr:hypothetical protein [Cytophagales bacterium]
MTSGIGKSIKILFGDKILAQFPEELADIAVAIEKSRYILDLEKDFDDMDSEPTSPETWQKAVRFVANYANWLFDLFGKKMAVPKIYHAPAGSMDVYWENERFNLLINIPPDKEPATFYGDNYQGQVTEGRFDPENFQQALLPDLSLIS